MASIMYAGNLRSSPRWLADFESPDNVLPIPAKLDSSQFTTMGGITVTLTANAAASATSVSVAALAYPFNPSTNTIAGGAVLIPSGTTLYFGGQKVATLTANAVNGATTLTVAPLPTALVSGDVANYNRFGNIYVPSGTVVGRTTAEQVAGTSYGPAVNTDNQIFLTMYDTIDAQGNGDVEFARNGAVVKVNYLPGYGANLALGTLASPTSLLTALQGKYTLIVGKD